MTRRKSIPIKRLSIIEIFNELTESFDSVINTDFNIINFGGYFACRFKTNSGNGYDLEFHDSEESPETILNGVKLCDIIKPIKNEVYCLDIAFSLSNVKNKNNPEEFEAETKLNEQHELMGRVTYIIKNIVNMNNKCKLFIIGGDAQRNRLKIYEAMFKNNFKDIFNIFYGKSRWHDGESLFIIRK